MTRPLRDLHSGVERLATQDYTARVAVASGDELGDIAEAFNRMTEIISRSHAALVERERNLKLCVPVKIGDDDLRERLALEFDDDPGVFIRLIPHSGDVRDDLLVDERSNLFFERGAGVFDELGSGKGSSLNGPPAERAWWVF